MNVLGPLYFMMLGTRMAKSASWNALPSLLLSCSHNVTDKQTLCADEPDSCWPCQSRVQEVFRDFKLEISSLDVEVRVKLGRYGLGGIIAVEVHQ